MARYTDEEKILYQQIFKNEFDMPFFLNKRKKHQFLLRFVYLINNLLYFTLIFDLNLQKGSYQSRFISITIRSHFNYFQSKTQNTINPPGVYVSFFVN